MNFNKKIEKAILKDLEARKARAHFYGKKEDYANVAELEKEWAFYRAGMVKRVPAEWIERYCEEDDE
ncbi:hypothetical protein HB904_03975 [Listeria booriae]|uniref:Uncharacterized protein n=1 Tax=Listeria booriae TaxID=1552123 RepID=A0A842AGF4_9LIST|nr:hypothetical protein [Listeria booriae]MBC1615330.1 hypothetical protein [Listeria booriae]